MRVRIYKSTIVFHDTITLEGAELHYIKNVLRLKPMDKVEIFNHTISLQCELIEITKNNATLNVTHYSDVNENLHNVHLFICIVKGDAMCDIVNSVTQLGIKAITPVISQNCYTRDINESRLNAVAISAIQQCNGYILPKINPKIQFNNLPKSINILYGSVLDKDNSNTLIKCISNHQRNEIGILIGPEGGFSASELEILETQSNFYGINLGSRIMRTETACTTIIALLLQHIKAAR